MKQLLFASLFLMGIAIFATSCVKDDFDTPPTGGSDPAISADQIMSIADLKAMHILENIEEVATLDNTKAYLKGTVVADDKSGNFYKNFILQDETGGIAVRLNRTDFYNFYPIGRTIYIQLDGLFMGDFAGVTQLGGYLYEEDGRQELGDIVNTQAHIIEGARGEDITPEVVSISGLNASHISTLIQLEGVEFASFDVGKTYADPIGQSSVNRTITDCNGNEIVVRSSGFSDFTADLTPGGNGTVTAIYSVFNDTKQLLLRSSAEVIMEGERCDEGGGGGGGGDPIDPVTELDEDFQSLEDYEDVFLSGWYNFAFQGTRLWRAREFEGNIYCQATAYQDTNPAMETWLITPGIILDGGKTLNFRSAQAFYAHDGLSVWISTDFDGENPTAASWQQLSPTLATSSTQNYTFVGSGDVDLSQYEGVGYIGFKYEGDGNSNTTSWIIDDVTIE